MIERSWALAWTNEELAAAATSLLCPKEVIMLPARGWIALAVLGLLTVPGQGQESPQTIIDRAIRVHGGMERLTRAQADRIKTRGNLFLNGKAVPFTNETTVQLPNKLKSVVTLHLDNQTHTLVQILNGEKPFVTLDGRPSPKEGSAVAEMRESLALARAIRLVPLLADRSYELASLPEIKVNDRPAVGVKVEVKGRKPILMYFDKETHFLVKTEHELDDGAGKSVTQEEYYSDFRDLQGFKRPIRIAVFRKGGKIMEAEMVEVKYYDRFDDDEFAKP